MFRQRTPTPGITSSPLAPIPLTLPLPRLLKVKPEERLTIEGVLAHPWLNCTEALDNVLPSAQMMMDKVAERLKHNSFLWMCNVSLKTKKSVRERDG